MNIVLLEPEIPQNTGNIGRTCCATGTKLHLIEPMGFKINEKSVKRAGMDYWEHLDVTIYESYEDFLEKNPNAKIWMATTKGPNRYSDVKFEENLKVPDINEDGDVWGIVGLSRDITDRKKLENKLRYLSYTDYLTGLYNRSSFE